MEKYYESQLSLQTKIANSFQNFKAKGKVNMSRGNAESRLANLEKNYSTFQGIHEKIMRLEKLDKSHPYFTSNLYDLVEDSFCDRRGDFLDFLASLKEGNSSETNSIPSAGSAPPNVAHISNVSFQSLPKIDLPKFSGKFSDWENFRDVFRSVIHRREGLMPVMKLHYLRTHLTSDVLEKIKSIPISGESYERAWATLVEYYENQRRIFSSHISEIFSVKPMKADSSSEIKRIYREIFNPITSLTTLNRAESLGSDLIVHFTVNHLDLNTRKEWERHLGDSVDPPTMDQLKGFLRSQTLTLESIESGTKSSSNNNPKTQASHSKSRKSEQEKTPSVFSHQTSPTNPSKKKCSFCNKLHFTYRCELFLNISVPERKELIKTSNVCFNCLGKHNVKSCTSTYRCFLCKAKHHTLVHSENNHAVSPLQTDQVDSATSTSTSNCGNLVVSNDLQSALHTVSLNTGASTKCTGVLLATARVNALGPNETKIQVRALVDPGS